MKTLIEAVEFVIKTFEESERNGAHTRDRQFAIDVLKMGLKQQELETEQEIVEILRNHPPILHHE